MPAWPGQIAQKKDQPEKRLSRRGNREAIDWIDAVPQLKGSICPDQFGCLQLFCPDSHRQAGARDLRSRLGGEACRFSERAG